MKRLWIGLALLLAVLLLSIWITGWAEEENLRCKKDADRAMEAALEGNWPKAQALILRSGENWQKRRPVTAMLTDHEPIEQIDMLYSQLKLYGQLEEKTDFISACAGLSCCLEDMIQAERLTVWTLF